MAKPGRPKKWNSENAPNPFARLICYCLDREGGNRENGVEIISGILLGRSKRSIHEWISGESVPCDWKMITCILSKHYGIYGLPCCLVNDSLNYKRNK